MYTVLGLIAILFFSTGVAFSRSLSEQLGTVTANALALLLAGGIGTLLAHLRGCSPLRKQNLYSHRVIIACLLFMASQVPFYLAVGLASSRSQAIIAGLINYLWCGFSVLLSVPILHKRPEWPILPGMLIAFVGVLLAVLGSTTLSAENLKIRDVLIYGAALIPALSWAFYSNLNRKWSDSIGQENVPLFVLFSGLILAIIRPLFNETTHWRIDCLPELLLMATVPILLAYFFWNWGIRKGNFIVIVSCSYFIPVLSVLFSCLYLRVPPTLSLGIGTAMVLIGSIICRYSIDEEKTAA